MNNWLANPNCLLNSRNRYQLTATIIVNIITFVHGFGVGWLSPMLTKLHSEDTPLSFTVSITESSWIGSLLGLGSITGNLLVGLLQDRVGRKPCIYLIAIPHLCIWILVYSAKSIEYLYVARYLAGITGGGSYIVLPMFISEIADKNVRGALASMIMLAVNVGILTGYIVATYVDYYVIPFVIITLPLTYLSCTVCLPETPYYLLRNEHYALAEQSFRFYKNIKDTDSFVDVQKSLLEYEELKLAIAFAKNEKANSFSYKDFVTPRAFKCYCTALVLLFVNQFSGLFSFANYMTDIFAASGTAMNVNTCTIIIGVVQICGVYTTTLLCDIYGRKLLMLVSTAGVALSLGAFACYTHYAQYYDLTDYDWLPLVLLSLDIFLGNIGLVGLFFVLLVEVYPAQIRPVAASASIVGVSILVFVTLKIFPICMVELGISVTMCACATVALFGFVYLYFFLEETKNKSMLDN